MVKSETINYKTGKPVATGLFCEKTFGPTKNNECACGRYKRFRNRGKVCERCEVLVTDSAVRRERMGHIELDDPVVHIWYHRSAPSKLALLLSLPFRTLEEIIYFDAYAVVNNGGLADLPLGTVISLKNQSSNFAENTETYSIIKKILQYLTSQTDSESDLRAEIEEYSNFLENQDGSFFVEDFVAFVNENSDIEFEMGGLAIEKLLKKIDIPNEITILKKKLAKIQNTTVDVTVFSRRLQILNSFARSGQKPE